jgi:hypothetical protein
MLTAGISDGHRAASKRRQHQTRNQEWEESFHIRGCARITGVARGAQIVCYVRIHSKSFLLFLPDCLVLFPFL